MRLVTSILLVSLVAIATAPVVLAAQAPPGVEVPSAAPDPSAPGGRTIAGQLDIGIDSLVLLDDNPAERAQVRAALPQVAVPELGEDPSQYVRVLVSAGRLPPHLGTTMSFLETVVIYFP